MLQVGLLNVDGYYDPLLMLFDKGATEGFIKQDCRDIIVSAPTAHELLKKMEVKWLHLLIIQFEHSLFILVVCLITYTSVSIILLFVLSNTLDHTRRSPHGQAGRCQSWAMEKHRSRSIRLPKMTSFLDVLLLAFSVTGPVFQASSFDMSF